MTWMLTHVQMECLDCKAGKIQYKIEEYFEEVLK